MSQPGSTAPLAVDRPPADGTWPWVPDQGDGTFRNPVLFADYSDPDAIRHGDDFYLTASSFTCTPGLPILHSRDLVNWTIVGHALRNLPDARYAEVQAGCGIWAPSLRFHAGRFWLFFPTPDEGIYVTTAIHPVGEWSEPHLVEAGKGLIDPCPFWDDDGKAYLVHAYAGSRSGLKHMLRLRPMAPDGSRLLGEGSIIFHAPERHPTIEGPKFHKRDGWYYLLAPAGGVSTGWQVALRSRNIAGPYEDRVVLEQGSTAINGPHQGALVDLPSGEWWFLHFQDAGVYGRVVHLQPVAWRDGWPLIGCDYDGNGVGEPVARCAKPGMGANRSIMVPQTSDEFDGSKLGLQWQWQANHRDDWYSLTAQPGWLRLFPQPLAQGDLARAAHVLLQKFPARSFGVETRLRFQPAQSGEEAGLVIMGDKPLALALRRHGSANQVVLHTNGCDQVLDITRSNLAKLRVQVEPGGRSSLAFALEDGDFVPVPGAFQASAGVWIGARVGLYSSGSGPETGGAADFDYFRFSPGTA
jgi:beta-xylosidase